MKTLVQFCLFLGVLLTVKCDGSPAQVHTANGPIVGETLDLGRSGSIHRFLGIPYAEPPVGELRFKKTKPLERKWSEPLTADKWPPMCSQNMMFIMNAPDKDMLFNKNASEDCLYLNVWTPAIEKEESKLRPVIVWIHGGGLFMGSPSMSLYDGKTLANMADAVVVTISYRLSTMGFLYSDQVEGVKGNQGLWDQATALQWVHDNIRSFGGDPKKVTIIGQSAGGWSVSSLIMSPVTRNLFQNAFMMSGVVDNRVAAKPEQMVKLFLNGIRAVGCATQHETSITQEVMNCINKLTTDQIHQIALLMNQQKLVSINPIMTVDGEFFTDSISEMIKKGDFKTDVNLLMSFVENEGYFLLKLMEPFRGENPPPISMNEVKTSFGKILNEQIFEHKKKVDLEKFYKLYLNGLSQLDDDILFRKRVSIAYGDILFNCAVMNFGRAIKLHSGEKASVFQLFYRLQTGNARPLCVKWSGACHVDDLYSLFGVPFQNPEEYTDRERDASGEIISFLSDFIRTGKPNTQKPQWQEYFLLDDKTVASPYYDLTNQATTYENFKFNLKQAECDFLSQYIQA